MRRKLVYVLLISVMCIFTLSAVCFAGVDEVKLFISKDFETNGFAQDATTYAANTFKKLGYSVRKQSSGIPYFIAQNKSTVLNYIGESGDNYGFYVFAHASPGVFGIEMGNSSSYIYPTNITGGWHFVWINGCRAMEDTSFAEAFHTIGYNNRASIGWYKTVLTGAMYEWGGYFYEAVGKMNLRDACLEAASHCTNSTPIRIYGDTSWYGYAWP